MPQVTINCAESKYVYEDNSVYATALLGATPAYVTGSTANFSGQYWNNGTNLFRVWQNLLTFDTSSIPAGSTITSVTLKAWINAVWHDDAYPVLEVYPSSVYSWLDFATASSANRLAYFDTTGATAPGTDYISFTSTSLFNDSITPAGNTYLVILNDRDCDGGTAPTTSGYANYAQLYTEDYSSSNRYPTLDIVYNDSALLLGTNL